METAVGHIAVDVKEEVLVSVVSGGFKLGDVDLEAD